MSFLARPGTRSASFFYQGRLLLNVGLENVREKHRTGEFDESGSGFDPEVHSIHI